MNPLFKALNGAGSAPQSAMGQSPSAISNMGGNGLFGRMQQLAGMFRNPQGMIQQVFPDAPAEVQNDPNQFLQWMQQSGKVNPQMVQMARNMMGR